MTKTRNLTTGICLAAIWLCSAIAFGQAKKDKPPEMTLKVYHVGDLFTPRPDYPYHGGLPTTNALNGNSNSTGGGIGGMGGMGGGMGGMGGGMFQVPDVIPRVAQAGGSMGGGLGGMGGLGGEGMGNSGPGVDETLRFTRDDLIRAITSTIVPDSWEVMGGEAVCTPLGGLLLIKQTAEAHRLIEELLKDIRTQGGSLHTVTVDATWLSLTSEEFEKLAPQKNGQGGELPAVDPVLLKELAAKNPSQQGRLSCYNDQTVHLVSGDRRTVVYSAVPTVGFYSTAYTPQIAIPNIGVLLQVRPTVDPDRKSAVLNLTSTVTVWQDPGDPLTIRGESKGGDSKGGEAAMKAAGGGGVAEGMMMAGGGRGGANSSNITQMTVDRVNIKTQHLGTTIRVPVGKPVLVGGMSNINNDPKTKADPEAKTPARQLYLVVKLTVNEAQK